MTLVPKYVVFCFFLSLLYKMINLIKNLHYSFKLHHLLIKLKPETNKYALCSFLFFCVFSFKRTRVLTNWLITRMWKMLLKKLRLETVSSYCTFKIICSENVQLLSSSQLENHSSNSKHGNLAEILKATLCRKRYFVRKITPPSFWVPHWSHKTNAGL